MSPDDIRRKVARFETCMEHDDRDIFYMGNALADVVEAATPTLAEIDTPKLRAALARVEALPP